jgi:hypothetical protein
MPLQNSVRSYLGIAKETTKGTGVTTPAGYIPVDQGKLKTATIIDPLLDEGLRGSLVSAYNWIPGRKYSQLEFGGVVFQDTFGWALAGLLGEDSVVGAANPYTHTIALKYAAAAGADAQPTSYTIVDFNGTNARAFAGCQFTDLTLNFSADGLLEYDAKLTGFGSTTATTPTPSFTTVTPMPVWKATVSIGGSSVAYTTEGSISMSRPVTPIFGVNNTQDPYQVFVGPLDVKGQFKFAMNDDTEVTRFLNQTSANLPAIVLNWSDGANIQVQATLTKGAYTTSVVDRGKDYVEVAVDVQGIANSTDAGSGGQSPIKWVLKNALPSGTYI